MLKVANSVISASRITGVLPVVNGGTGVTTSTGTGNTVLSATPTLSGNVNLSTGNLVIGTAGKGIDFSVTSSGSGTMTSELLADYEEGTWTPNVGGTATYLLQKASYIKVGRLVTVSFDMEINVLGTGNVYAISGLPFTVGSGTSPKFEQGIGASGYFQSLAVTVYMLTFYASVNGTDIYAISTNSLGATANVNPAIYGSGTRVQGTVTYMATT